MVDWWASPLSAADENRFGLSNFSVPGVAPIGYAAFAFAIGVAAGVPLRHTIVVIAVTCVGFNAACLTVTYRVRRNPTSPVRQILPLSARLGDRAGHAPSSHCLAPACPVIGQFAQQLAASGGKLSSSVHTVLTYQPASRFCPFAEKGIFLTAALALCGITYWWAPPHA